MMASSIPAAANGGLHRECQQRHVVSEEGSIRDEESGGSGASLLHSIGDVLEDREVEMRLAGLLWVGTADNFCACSSGISKLRIEGIVSVAGRVSAVP